MTVGEKIRLIRKEKGITLIEAAQKAGCSPSLISQVERGLINPSLASLQYICNAIDLPVSALFDENQFTETFNDGFITPENKRVIVKSGPGWMVQLLNPYRKRTFDMLVIEADPGEDSGYSIGHEGEECLHVLQGTLCMVINDTQELIAHAGDTIFFDSAKTHQWKNIGNDKMIAIVTIAPSNIK